MSLDSFVAQDRVWRSVRGGGSVPFNATQHARATVPEEVWTTYGARYPLTYRFTVNPADDLVVRYRHQTSETWQTAPEFTRADMVNGEAGVRFDGAGKAFVSLPFGEDAPATDILFEHAAGGRAAVTFDEVCEFYDDRLTSLTLTWDDWTSDSLWHSQFVACHDAHVSRGLWWCPGVNGGGTAHRGWGPISDPQWAEMQACVDEGYLEPLNHGYEHRDAEAVGYDGSDMTQGAQVIRDKLTLPWQNRRGSNQYVLGWVEPFGNTSSALLSALNPAGMINQRTWTTYGMEDWRSWSGADKVYARGKAAVNLDECSAAFDYSPAYSAWTTLQANRWPAVFGGHPWRRDGDGQTGRYHWEDPTDLIHDFLDEVSGREDIWYVGWGHLYLYRREFETVTVTTP